MKTKKIEVEFSEIEIKVLQIRLADNAEALAVWDVTTLPELVRLLTLHGSDHIDDLVSNHD